MDFNKLDLKELDKDLSEEQLKEWNAIYSSFRAGGILTNKVIGVDTNSMKVNNPKTGDADTLTINCLVIVAYRVKILIPETEVWFDENEQQKRPPHVLRSMAGSVIDYVITFIDREGDYAIASRRQALVRRRRSLARRKSKANDKITCRVLALGKTRCLVECSGYDIMLSQRDLSYGMLPDLREVYRPGEEHTAIIKEIDLNNDVFKISVKEAEPHPFDGAEQRHPVHSRRASTITGKYGGGVFCRLDKNLDCLCTLSPDQLDSNFCIGDEVIIAITRYNYDKKQIFGKIVSKW